VDRFRHQRVLICGGNISALEIASELAVSPTTRVVIASRRQRYVVQKLIAGVPADQIVFTRYAAHARTTFPPDQQGRALKEFIVRTCGSPEQFGAPPPAEDVFAAGLTLSQQFLPLVAEGRITCRPWPQEVRGQDVRFGDGREEPFDGIILGTGFDIDLPFLDSEIQRMLDVNGTRVDLHPLTFHPDLPGLAFIGQFELVGPYFPVAELQTRWIAYAWSGTVRAPTEEAMKAGVAAYRARRAAPQLVLMDMAAMLFAREAGVDPMLPR
jgi:dimethylaniline monooxygenase (N-oxide forming)